MSQTPLRHRPDIDGLRALAILTVVMFHAGWLPGGFIGVDVFFVLSGFLMARILASDLQAGRWSLAGFYRRRALRIVPALVVMSLIVAALAAWLLLPTDLPDLGRALAATATFTANWRFHEVAGDYFQASTLAEQPLLHAWTLAVEMQFYLLFPLLLWLAWRAGGRTVTVWVLAGVALLSFGYGGFLRHDDPGAVFYFLSSRAWELLAGAMVGLLPALARRWRTAAAVTGPALIVAGLVLCRPGGDFPVPTALLPVLGTVLILSSAPGVETGAGWIATLLRHRLVAFVATISYPLYLWHWPLLALARYRTGQQLEPMTTLVLIGLAVALATVSWTLVERPLLRRRRAVALRSTLPWLASALVMVFLVGIAVRNVLPEVMLDRLPPQVAELAAAEHDRLRLDCDPDDDDGDRSSCRFGAASAPADTLLWGNSYARMWLPGIDAAARDRAAAGHAYVRSACIPSIGGDWRPECNDFNARVLARIAADPDLRRIVIAANWYPDTPFAGQMRELVAALEHPGRELIVVLAPPEPEFPVPRQLALAQLRGEPPAGTFAGARHLESRQYVVAALQPLVEEGRISVLDPTALLCDRGQCRLRLDDGTVLYHDGTHITRSGARSLKALFAPVFADD